MDLHTLSFASKRDLFFNASDKFFLLNIINLYVLPYVVSMTVSGNTILFSASTDLISL